MKRKQIVGIVVASASALIVFGISRGLPHLSNTTRTMIVADDGALENTEVPGGADVDPKVLPLPRESIYEESGGDEGDSNSVDSIGEAAMREIVRENAHRDISKLYSRLFEDAGLLPAEQEAILELLVDDQVASTWTDYWQGIDIDVDDRNARISQIIGDAKLAQFLECEAYLDTYAHVNQVDAVLGQSELQLTGTQREKLFEQYIVIDSRFKQSSMPDVEPNSIEFLEQRLTTLHEYQRLVMEQAASALSPKQVAILDQHYLSLSYARAAALELQKNQRAQNPELDSIVWYPAQTD